MATSNKSKKILEKARKIAAKTKKKKVSKVDVKKKTTSYPEGQNAPQSKKYTQESDKTLSAKATGWRWTKEGAKKLGKNVESKPTTSDIEKYRNETFKLKGKPNKSGPKGVGDGSHRYLYVERRADKADITRKNKLADGGMMAKGGEVLSKKELEDIRLVRDDDDKDKSYYYNIRTKKEVDENKIPKGVFVKEYTGDDMAKGGKTKKFLTYYEVYDENTDKTLNIQAYSFEEAEEIASTIEYDNFKDGEDIEYGEMARGGKIPSSEVAEFKKYVKGFYGKDEIYSEFFPPFGVTSEEVNHAVRQYIDYCKIKDDQWGGGDSFDREIVRDIMLYNRGTKKGLEYQRAIKEIFAKDKKEYGGILQPMTGGVNADPRFDIYNTTMFAEKGAELANGGKLKVVPIYLYEVTYSKHGKKGTFVSKVKAKSEEDAINKWIDETNRTEGVYTIIDVVKSTRTRMEEGGEMAKGGGVKYSLDYFKMKLDELDPNGNIYINYDEDDNQWYWEDYQNDTYRDGFKSEKDAYDDAIGYLDSLGGDVEYAKGGTTFGEFGSGRLNKNAWISANYIGDSKVKLGDLQSYLERNTNEDFDKNKIYTITRTLFKSGDYEIDDNKDWKLSTIYRKRKMAKGGKTHEQGYDDREDESLAMRHGKIASKDFVGSHKRKEHSRRDDARFEERHKKAYGGTTDASIELLD